MNEERMRVLRMLEEGRITAEEAEKLLEALRAQPEGQERPGRESAKRAHRRSSAAGANAAYSSSGEAWSEVRAQIETLGKSIGEAFRVNWHTRSDFDGSDDGEPAGENDKDSAGEPVKEIDVPFPETEELHLHIKAGICRLRIRPGESEPWVQGSYRDPSGKFSLRMKQRDGTLRLITEVGHDEEWKDVVKDTPRPDLDLALGAAKAYSLVIEGAASDLELDLGGLPLRRLEIKGGAGKYQVDFSAPNPEPMSQLRISIGAGMLELKNLANANFDEAKLNAGAASCAFDFGGVLQREAQVKIATGLSSVSVAVPNDTAAKVSVSSKSFASSVNVGNGFTDRAKGLMWTQAAIEGKTPVLTINAESALATLNLRTT